MKKLLELGIRKAIFICFFSMVVGSLGFSIKNIVTNCSLDKWTVSSILIIGCAVMLFVFLMCVIDVGKNEWVLPMAIVLISLCVHFIVIFLMGESTIQTSDLRDAIEASKMPLYKSKEWYCTFSSWAIVPVYYKVVGIIFGTQQLVLVGIYLNCLYKTFTALNIYFLVKIAGINRRIGFVAAMLFVFWPMHLIYSICPTPENINVWLISLSLLLYAHGILKIKKQELKFGMVFMTIASVILSVAGFFKSVDKLMLIVFACMVVLWLLINSCKEIKKYMLVFILCIVAYVGTTECIYKGLEIVYDAPVNRDIIPHYLYIGLAPPAEDKIMGVHTKENGIYKHLIVEYDYDYKKTKEVVLERLFKEISEEGIGITDFIDKFELTWGEASYLTWPMYALEKDNVEIINRKNVATGFSSLVKISYSVILLCMTCGAVRILREKEINWLMIMGALYILGYVCMLLLSECQPRYKCIVYPYMAIVAAYGIDDVLGKLKTEVSKYIIRT